ncbi:MAG: hypothetical protein IJN76_00750 [Clostridia bacterium]|nr:hypothetical protein [Clostridia bacterium]
MSQITPEQMEKLLEMAASRLNTTPDKLKQTLAQNGLEGALSQQDAARAQAMLEDKDKRSALLADPSVRRLLNQLLG